MGRKKRKAPAETAAVSEGDEVMPEATPKADVVLPGTPTDPRQQVKQPVGAAEASKQTPASSGYAMSSHSGNLVEEDIYVSEGSESDSEGGSKEMDVVLAGSRMGVMRRGMHHPSLLVQNRQWVRSSQNEDVGDGTQNDQSTEAEMQERRRQKEEEELASLDPAQRAARLLVEKQKKLEEAKEAARRLESEENAGRDPCLFSKRTAFDIRMDQIEDKPWLRGQGDLTDFFNYNLTEEDWLEYSQGQLQIRQELTDASRQRRQPDPTVVPVVPRTPQKQNPKVATASSIDANKTTDDGTDTGSADKNESVIGPVLLTKKDGVARRTSTSSANEDKMDVAETTNIDHVGVGGAWGAGAAPDSVLARLIEEQEQGKVKPSQANSSSSTQRKKVPDTDTTDERYQENHDRRQESAPEAHNKRSYHRTDRQNDWRHENIYERGRGYEESQAVHPNTSYQSRQGSYATPSYGRGRGYSQRPYNQQQYGHWGARGGRGGRGSGHDYHSRKRYRDDYESNDHYRER